MKSYFLPILFMGLTIACQLPRETVHPHPLLLKKHLKKRHNVRPTKALNGEK